MFREIAPKTKETHQETWRVRPSSCHAPSQRLNKLVCVPSGAGRRPERSRHFSRHFWQNAMLTLLLLLTGGAGVEIKVLDRREAEEMMRSRSLLFGSTGHAEPEKPADPPPTCPQGTVPFVGDGKASIFDLSLIHI